MSLLNRYQPFLKNHINKGIHTVAKESAVENAAIYLWQTVWLAQVIARLCQNYFLQQSFETRRGFCCFATHTNKTLFFCIVNALRHLNKYLIQYKYHILLGTLATIAANIFSIVPARLIRHAFELIQRSIADYQALAGTSLQAATYTKLAKGLLIYSGLILLATILRGALFLLARWPIMIVGKRVEYALKNEIYAHYQTLPMRFYRRNSTGDLMARISEDVNQVGMYLGPAIIHGINTIVILLMLIPYMLIVNAHLTRYAVLPILILAVGTYYVSTFMKERAEAIQRHLSSLTTFVQESFAGISVLQAFARESAFTKTFSEQCETYKTQFLRLTTINAIFFPVTRSIIGLGAVLVVFIGGQEVISGTNTPGNIAEFVMYVNLLGWPIFAVSWVNNIIQRAAASQKRINEFLQEQNPIVSQKALKQPLKGDIAFKNVSLTYPNSGIKALQSATFAIAPGSTAAIIGATGAGKSTIAHLISRLYDPDTGTITIDGVPIQDYDVPFLRQQIGYVPQEVLLFSDTLKNNIAWGKPDATNAQIIKAAQLAAIYEDIQRLPKQMDTMLGEKGATLSGGQKQRIAIARAFIRTPKILILDDCLSAVDTQTAEHILHNIKHAMQESTVFIIAHNIASSQLADQILVLEAGKLVEQGTHKDLLTQKGIYYALHEQQPTKLL
ncbi:MAG: ABC transporter ATP-binding protein [Bacteroidota bacterium]